MLYDCRAVGWDTDTTGQAGDYSVDPEKNRDYGLFSRQPSGVYGGGAFRLRERDRRCYRQISSRPNAAVLCYPVVPMYGPNTHGGSKSNFLGAGASDRELAT